MEKQIREFQAELEKAGIIATEVIADGHIHRCATSDKPNSRNGWYILHGDEPAVALFGNWRTGERGKWTSRNGTAQTPAERALFRKRLEEIQKLREQEERKRHELAKERARKILERCKPARVDHPYLAKMEKASPV